MPLTPSQVVAQLTERGIKVSLRRLRDWRDEGLLPAMKQRGLGQGKGVIYAWDAPDIVDRAALIHNLLEFDTQVETAVIHLWLLGYDVPVAKFRTNWARRIEKMQRQLEVETGRHSDPEDGLGEYAASMYRQLEERTGFSGVDFKDLVVMIVEAAFGNSDQFDPADVLQLVGMVLTDQFIDKLPRNLDHAVSATDGQFSIEPVIHLLNITRAGDLIEGCSDERLINSQRIWWSLQRAARAFAPSYFREENPEALLSKQVLFGATYGRAAIPIIAFLLNQGCEAALIKFVEAMSDFAAETRLEDLCRAITLNEPALEATRMRFGLLLSMLASEPISAALAAASRIDS